jgi:hypothetical protein
MNLSQRDKRPSASIGQMLSVKQQLFQQLRQQSIINSLPLRAKRARLEKLLGVPNLEALGQDAFTKRLPDDFAFMLEDADVIIGLAHVFIAYRLRFAEEREKKKPEAEILAVLGPAPWDVVNETLQAAGFLYRVISPIGTKLIDNYDILFEDEVSRQPLQPMDLSSGEKVILQLVLWLYNSKHHGRFPRLFLLDEPDAHLHPSMTRQFMDVIKDVLVERYKVRVIITTHSPSTVALAPENSIFEMSRGDPQIRSSTSREETIGLLTAGLVTVSRSTHYIMVEDDADVNFYGAVRDVLSDYGPSKDPKALRPAPSLVFLPASLGEGKSKVSGGINAVKQWVDKFDVPPLNQFFRGVIDRDAGNTPTEHIDVVGRYSIENYLLDPFIVFGILIEEGTAPTIDGLSISKGDEHRLRAMSEPELQSILVAIRTQITPNLPNLAAEEQEERAIAFTNGKIVQYPAWMIDRRGHDLMPLYQERFGGPKVISPPRLLSSLSRIRLIPAELADVLNKLQN